MWKNATTIYLVFVSVVLGPGSKAKSELVSRVADVALAGSPAVDWVSGRWPLPLT